MAKGQKRKCSMATGQPASEELWFLSFNNQASNKQAAAD